MQVDGSELSSWSSFCFPASTLSTETKGQPGILPNDNRASAAFGRLVRPVWDNKDLNFIKYGSKRPLFFLLCFTQVRNVLFTFKMSPSSSSYTNISAWDYPESRRHLWNFEQSGCEENRHGGCGEASDIRPVAVARALTLDGRPQDTLATSLRPIMLGWTYWHTAFAREKETT